jgi:hypothetical protein
MRNLPFSDDSNQPFTTGSLSVGLPDDPSAEMSQANAEGIFAALAMSDERHCRDCGDITSGSAPAGGHVQLCDTCLARWCVQQLGAAIVRDALSAA